MSASILPTVSVERHAGGSLDFLETQPRCKRAKIEAPRAILERGTPKIRPAAPFGRHYSPSALPTLLSASKRSQKAPSIEPPPEPARSSPGGSSDASDRYRIWYCCSDQSTGNKLAVKYDKNGYLSLGSTGCDPASIFFQSYQFPHKYQFKDAAGRFITAVKTDGKYVLRMEKGGKDPNVFVVVQRGKSVAVSFQGDGGLWYWDCEKEDGEACGLKEEKLTVTKKEVYSFDISRMHASVKK